MFGPVAQWIEQLPSKQWVVGSIPPRTTIFISKRGSPIGVSSKKIKETL